MPSRIIRSHRESNILLDSFGSFLTLEAMKPSSEIYIISPWVSNSPILDNSCGRFSDVFPYTESGTVYLADVLCTYAFKGSIVRLICNLDNRWTREFINEVKKRHEGRKIEFRVLKDNHEKGMVTENFYLHGSMNFTFNGIHINSENVRITTDASDISSALLSVRARWGESEGI